ncbi:hypothetical protein E2C01_055797 [Portunus trituberculatus]|uniref:Uncharacterized protein n=1 Tax=Portunus trituberculatus TaxID=210409 RepID=A0A5B7GS88_PORTR|nr:hypothetical protein [Portunus trituberculatus]
MLPPGHHCCRPGGQGVTWPSRRQANTPSTFPLILPSLYGAPSSPMASPPHSRYLLTSPEALMNSSHSFFLHRSTRAYPLSPLCQAPSAAEQEPPCRHENKAKTDRRKEDKENDINKSPEASQGSSTNIPDPSLYGPDHSLTAPGRPTSTYLNNSDNLSLASHYARKHVTVH